MDPHQDLTSSVAFGTDRIARLLGVVAERGLEALVVFSDGSCNILRASYLQYVAGVRPMGPACAVLLASGDVRLMVTPAWDAERIAARSWIDDVAGVASLATALPSFLDQRGVRGAIGLAGDHAMTVEVYEALAEQRAIVPADAMVEAVAQVMRPDDVALAHEVAGIADVGFAAFLEAARVGIREYELVAEIEHAMRLAGADDNFILIGSGPHNEAMRAPVDRRLVPGDIVIVEITPERGGLFIQLCRTVVLGAAPRVLADGYALLTRAFEAGAAELSAGVPVSRMAVTINRMLAEAGYGEYCRPPFMRTRGHGFGVGSIGPGMVIDEHTDHVLTEDQVIVVHPNQYLPETGYLACGETLLVKRDGAERLARTDTRLYVRGAQPC